MRRQPSQGDRRGAGKNFEGGSYFSPNPRFGWRVLQAVLPPARDRLRGRFMGVSNAPMIAAAPTSNFPACKPQRRAKTAKSGIGLEAFGTTTAWARLPTRHGGELSARQSRGLGVNVGAKR